MAQDIIGYNPCKKIDAADINAYFCMGLNEENPVNLELDTPWGISSLDLTPALEAGMVGGSIALYPDPNPDRLRYTKGSAYDDIMGVDLSRIIRMQLLQDVDQTVTVGDGDVYMFNGTTNLFEPFNVQNQLNTLTGEATKLDGQLSSLEVTYQGFQTTLNSINSALDDLEERVSALENGDTPEPEPEPPLPESAPYGFIYYTAPDSSAQVYALANESDFQKLGNDAALPTPQTIEFANLTVSNTAINGYEFMDYVPAQLPAGFLAMANLTHDLDLPSTMTAIPANFLNSAIISAQITMPNSIGTIGNGFLAQASYRHSQGLEFPANLSTIGNNFMSSVMGIGSVQGYPYPITLPNGLKTIGSFFLSTTHNGNVTTVTNPTPQITIPSTVTSIGGHFMYNFDAATEIVANTVTTPKDDHYLSLTVATSSNTITPAWTAYTEGITISGTRASTWLSTLPNLEGAAFGTTQYVWRKFVEAS